VKALSRCKDSGWWSDRVTSFFFTLLAYTAVISVVMLGRLIYQMFPPLDWDEILTIAAGAFFFCVNWYLIDDTLWS